MSSSSKALFKIALRHSDIIDQAYFDNGGKIVASEEIEPAINLLIKHRLAWRLDDMDGAQLSSSLISLLSRTGSAARRSRGSAEISSLWCQLEELLEDYIIVKTKNRQSEMERLSCDMHECTFEIIESIGIKLISFAKYIDQGFSAVSDIELRLLHNKRALKEAEQLNNLLCDCDLNEFTVNTSFDSRLRKLFKISLVKALSSFRKELVRVLHDLRKLVTKLQADSLLARQLINFRKHYDRNPGFIPTPVEFIDKIPAILTQTAVTTSFAYPDLHQESHKDIILKAISLVRKQIFAEQDVETKEIDIEDVMLKSSSLTDVGELYEKSLSVIEFVKSGELILASTAYKKLEVKTTYNYWLLALLNTISGLEKKQRQKIKVNYVTQEHGLFNGNLYVEDLSLCLN